MKKRIISLLICVALLLAVTPTVVFAADIASGTGWYLSSDGVLHITGAVPEERFGLTNNQKDQVKSAIAESGSSVSDCSFLFSDCKYMVSADLSKLNFASVKNMRNMFIRCSALTTVKLNNTTAQVTDMSYMFSNCSSLVSVDLSNLNTSSVQTMCNMFGYCKKLTDVNMTGWNTSRLTDTSYMFAYCDAITGFDIKSISLNKVTDMGYMFTRCKSLKNISLAGVNAPELEKTQQMFEGCPSLVTVDFSGFRADKLKDMSYMFEKCSSLISIDMSDMDTPVLSSFESIFKECTKLKYLDLSGISFHGYAIRNSLHKCTNLHKITLNSGFVNYVSSDLISLSSNWKNVATGEVYKSQFDLNRITEACSLFSGTNHEYDTWVGSVRVSDMNADDVLGDGGSVKYYAKGEYTGINSTDGSEYGSISSVLILNGLSLKDESCHSDGKNAAQVYIDEDSAVVLKGTNTLNSKGAANGMYISGSAYVSFYGDGKLNIDASINDADAIKCSGASLFFRENTKVALVGAHAVNSQYSPIGDRFFELSDNAFVSCYAAQNHVSQAYPALVISEYIIIKDNAKLIAETYYKSSAISSWANGFSNEEYEIKILKNNEMQSSGYKPYAPAAGLNVTEGVRESDCRYIEITPKHKTPSVKKGDFDKDGEITVTDALAALRIAAKLATETSEDIAIGDTDNDGHVTVTDALAILRVAAKLVTEL